MGFSPPVYAGSIHYPEWAHGLGYFLILIAAAQFPVWAILLMLYYLCHPKKRFMDVFRPTPEWGPGDRSRRNSGWRRSGRDKCCRGTTTPPWPTRTTTMATATTATMDTCDLCTRTKLLIFSFQKCSKA